MFQMQSVRCPFCTLCNCCKRDLKSSLKQDFKILHCKNRSNLCFDFTPDRKPSELPMVNCSILEIKKDETKPIANAKYVSYALCPYCVGCTCCPKDRHHELASDLRVVHCEQNLGKHCQEYLNEHPEFDFVANTSIIRAKIDALETKSSLSNSSPYLKKRNRSVSSSTTTSASSENSSTTSSNSSSSSSKSTSSSTSSSSSSSSASSSSTSFNLSSNDCKKKNLDSNELVEPASIENQVTSQKLNQDKPSETKSVAIRTEVLEKSTDQKKSMKINPSQQKSNSNQKVAKSKPNLCVKSTTLTKTKPIRQYFCDMTDTSLYKKTEPEPEQELRRPRIISNEILNPSIDLLDIRNLPRIPKINKSDDKPEKNLKPETNIVNNGVTYKVIDSCSEKKEKQNTIKELLNEMHISGDEEEEEEAKKKEAKEKEAKDREAKEKEAKKKEAKEKEAKEREAKKKEADEKEAKEIEAKKKEADEKEAKEKEAKEKEAKEKEAKEKEAQEKEAKEKEAKEKEAKEKEAKEKEEEAKEKKVKEQDSIKFSSIDNEYSDISDGDFEEEGEVIFEVIETMATQTEQKQETIETRATQTEQKEDTIEKSTIQEKNEVEICESHKESDDEELKLQKELEKIKYEKKQLEEEKKLFEEEVKRKKIAAMKKQIEDYRQQLEDEKKKLDNQKKIEEQKEKLQTVRDNFHKRRAQQKLDNPPPKKIIITDEEVLAATENIPKRQRNHVNMNHCARKPNDPRNRKDK